MAPYGTIVGITYTEKNFKVKPDLGRRVVVLKGSSNKGWKEGQRVFYDDVEIGDRANFARTYHLVNTKSQPTTTLQTQDIQPTSPADRANVSPQSIYSIIEETIPKLDLKGLSSLIIHDTANNSADGNGVYHFIVIGKTKYHLESTLGSIHHLGLRTREPSGPIYCKRLDGVYGVYYQGRGDSQNLFMQDPKGRERIYLGIVCPILSVGLEGLISRSGNSLTIELEVLGKCVNLVRFN